MTDRLTDFVLSYTAFVLPLLAAWIVVEVIVWRTANRRRTK